MVPATATIQGRRPWRLTGAALVLLLAGGNAVAGSVLFIGNSFTLGFGSPVRFYRAEAVTDLNGQGNGGVAGVVQIIRDRGGSGIRRLPGNTARRRHRLALGAQACGARPAAVGRGGAGDLSATDPVRASALKPHFAGSTGKRKGGLSTF